MHFVGVDLAWGERKPTGVAVVDDRGRLCHVSTQGTDAEIVAALAGFVGDGSDCLVAIDAPLVVANASGNRPGEAALNRDFARFDAGAHPANTGKPEFREGPRAARLAAALRLDPDPDSVAGRRAIEVYPHPATVALFRLGRTLKYKNKPGRSLDMLRAELLALTVHVESLASADPALDVSTEPRWQDLVTRVETAERKSELRIVEDQVDAVVCAYVALFAQRRPELTTTYGDLAGGYIVTPTLPADLRPTPRVRAVPAPTSEPTPAPDEGPAAAIAAYAAGHPALVETTDRFVELVTQLLDDAGINYLSVTGRAKGVASFAAKAHRTVGDRWLFPEPLTQITDQVGLRVITYLHRDVAAVADLLGDLLALIDDRDMGQETADEGRFGYASRHLLVSVPEVGGLDVDRRLRGRSAQVQVRTVLQHAWAEFEHATRYKGTIPEEYAPDLDRRFTLAAGLLELADREFSAIHERLRSAAGAAAVGEAGTDPHDPRISAEELATFLTGRYAEAGWSRPDHYAWMSGLLLELGITSLDELAVLLSSVDGEAINARMDYRYPPGAVRRLDDALLAVSGSRYVTLHGNAHRAEGLRSRLEKLQAAED